MSESLREQLQANADKILSSKEDNGSAPASEEPVTGGESQDAPTRSQEAESKPGRTAGRPRDEQGRLLPGKPQVTAKTSAAEPGKASPAQTPNAQTVQAAPAAEVSRPKYPSTWKKDFEQHFSTVDPKFAEYLLQREQQYASGVSAYKGQWDQAKPILDAIAPHRQMLEQYKIDPARQIDRYFRIHQALALGSPEQKLAVLAQVAQDYQVPIQNLLQQGQDGKFYLNVPQSQPFQSPAMTPEQLEQIVESKLQERSTLSEVAAFGSAKGADGKPLYPHFEKVRGVMAGLLQAGQAQDLADAYAKAVRLDDELFAEQQETLRAQKEEAARREREAQVQRAKQANVSVKTQTPSVAAGDGKPKGLRAVLTEQVNSRMGGGRV